MNVWHSGARATSGCCSLHAGQQAPLDDMNVLVCASLPADSDPPVPPAPIATFVATAPAIQRETMEGQIKANMYLEHGEYQGHLYGTNVQSIVAELQKGRTCILDVHPKILPRVRNSTLQPIIVLVIPPSLSRLQQARGTTMYVITGVSFGSSGDWGPEIPRTGCSPAAPSLICAALFVYLRLPVDMVAIALASWLALHKQFRREARATGCAVTEVRRLLRAACGRGGCQRQRARGSVPLARRCHRRPD